MTLSDPLPDPFSAAAEACAREPIHIPGAVQPHGILLVLDGDLTITQVSANVEALLEQPAAALAGTDFRKLVPASALELVERLIREAASTYVNPFRVPVTTGAGVRNFDGIAHVVEGTGTVLELELDPEGNRSSTQGLDNYLKIVQRSLGAISDTLEVGVIAGVMAAEVKAFTGFDRVMVYRFAQDFHGHVIGEALEEGMEPYLGLHYPAADIPPQARALYLRNPVRLLHDVDAAPAPLVPELHPRTGGPLDMSQAVLRAMSPVHRQYLRNMGVASSLSISLVVGDQLWGLIACHHRTPRFVPYAVRATVSLYAIVLAAQLDVKQHSLAAQRVAAGRHMALSILTGLQDYSEPLGNLPAMLPLFMELFTADAAVLITEEEVFRAGAAPEKATLAALREELGDGTGDGVVISNHTGSAFRSLAGQQAVAAGLVGVHLGGREWLILFRGEVARVIRWAGDPRETKASGPGGALTPRNSFSEWLQEVEGECEPWPDHTPALTTEVRSGILEIFRQRNILLARSNQDLRRFAGVVAHEVKNHLQTSIMALSILEERLSTSTDESMGRLATLGKERLSGLSKFTNDMLAFADTEINVSAEAVDLGGIAREVVADLHLSGLAAGTRITVDPLPVVMAPRTQIHHVIANLLRNAVLHGRVADRILNVTIGARLEDGTATIHVRDDGRGIPEAQRGKIFDYFQRGDTKSAGSGIGLGFCAQVIARMNHRMWVEKSDPQGATFLFTVPLAETSNPGPA